MTGQVTYAGTRTFQVPMLVVMVKSSPDAAIPYAVTRMPGVNLAAPIPYELRFVPAGTWYVMAAIDEAATFAADTASVGGYPNTCVLAAMPDSRSLTVADAGLSGIDMTVYDPTSPDPCFLAGGTP